MEVTGPINLFPILVTIAGTLILLLIAAVTFFIVMLIREVKQNTKDVSKLYGLTQSQFEKHNGEIKTLNERTEMQIQQLTKNVNELTNLVKIILKQKISED